MSLNNLRLPDVMIAELYGDTLVGSTDVRAAAETPAARTVPPSSPAAVPIPPSPPVQPLQRTEPAATPQTPQRTEPSLPTAPASDPTSATKPEAAPQPLFSTPSAPISPTGSTAGTYKFLGNNKRRIALLVQSPGAAFLPDDQLTFLTKILEACQLNIGDVAILNQATAPIDIAVLKQQLQPATLILFGLDPLQIQLPISFPVFKVQEYDKTSYLCAPPLTELTKNTNDSKLLKSKLWICLKTLFSV